MKSTVEIQGIKAIMGLGNPGQAYYKTRHSIGYRIVDSLADILVGNGMIVVL